VTAEPFDERIARASDLARSAGAGALLASDLGTVRWLTGRCAEIEFGPSVFSAGTHVLLTDGGGAVVCPDEERDLAPLPARLALAPYEAFTAAVELVPHRRAAAALHGAVRDAALAPAGAVAVEAAALPLELARALGDRPLLDVGPELRRLRMVKDAAELERLRRSAEVTDAGQRAFRAALEPGITEVELWSRVHAAMEGVAGVRVPVLPDLMFGERTLLVGVPPTDRRLAAGELALCDLSARRGGYWSDSCVTICAGTPTAAMRRLHSASMRALEAGIAAARPGVTAAELDGKVRSVLADEGYTYAIHTGHGLGVTGHEEPRIVPGAETTLDEDMVVALEPGAYPADDGIGIRVEHVLVVRPGNGEILTSHALHLEAGAP
jgi:Xaa-Pro dipeptidase